MKANSHPISASRSYFVSFGLCGLLACALLVLAGPRWLRTAAAQQGGAGSRQSPLTVERIYSAPSLSGRPLRETMWSPDGKLLTYLDDNAGEPEIWAVDAAAGQRHVLIDAQRRTGLGLSGRAGSGDGVLVGAGFIETGPAAPRRARCAEISAGGRPAVRCRGHRRALPGSGLAESGGARGRGGRSGRRCALDGYGRRSDGAAGAGGLAAGFAAAGNSAPQSRAKSFGFAPRGCRQRKMPDHAHRARQILDQLIWGRLRACRQR